jgi:hypothetical protein
MSAVVAFGRLAAWRFESPVIICDGGRGDLVRLAVAMCCRVGGQRDRRALPLGLRLRPPLRRGGAWRCPIRRGTGRGAAAACGLWTAHQCPRAWPGVWRRANGQAARRRRPRGAFVVAGGGRDLLRSGICVFRRRHRRAVRGAVGRADGQRHGQWSVARVGHALEHPCVRGGGVGVVAGFPLTRPYVAPMSRRPAGSILGATPTTGDYQMSAGRLERRVPRSLVGAWWWWCVSLRRCSVCSGSRRAREEGLQHVNRVCWGARAGGRARGRARARIEPELGQLGAAGVVGVRGDDVHAEHGQRGRDRRGRRARGGGCRIDVRRPHAADRGHQPVAGRQHLLGCAV